jgi:hypothetical protein
MQAVFRRNHMFAMNFKKQMGSVTKQVMGTAIAYALHKAVLATYHDSSRAAANWNIAFGGTAPAQTWYPDEYLETGSNFGSIGEKGSKRGESGGDYAIAGYKSFYYGYEADGGSGVTLSKGGRIWKELGIGEFKTPPKVIIYNPIFDPAFGPYPTRAFGSAIPKVWEDELFPQSGPLRSKIAGMLPGLIHDAMIAAKHGRSV